MAVAGERVGAYEIIRFIARGGMATVFEARQPALDRVVALKRLDLRTDDPTLVNRFIQESRIAASFEHPNIVTLFDFFEAGGVPYIAMDGVRARQPLPISGSRASAPRSRRATPTTSGATIRPATGSAPRLQWRISTAMLSPM